ncbi:MAG: GAF domain-containing protein [Acidobacteriia bacterium]|nr:GAF domain-containing protein [Terriglobia bacterium]
MDRYSIVDRGSAQPLPEAVAAPGEGGESAALAPVPVREPLRFPGDDGGKSLSEMALRDLDSALQLLVERAQYITGASGAAIALRVGGDMICRATAGPSAPELGAHLQINSGLSGESVRTRQILRCDNAETDPRVNRESCRALGIASVVVMPLQREQEVNGVFELFSGRAYAFEERDITALQRLAEMIQTAFEHADAAKRAEQEIAAKVDPPTAAIVAVGTLEDAPQFDPEFEHPAINQQPAKLQAAKPAVETVAKLPETLPAPAADQPKPVLLTETGKIRKCEACGFPVSEGRTLCLDCEAARVPAGELKPSEAGNEAPEFLSQITAGNQEGWLQSHKYLVGILVAVVVLVVVLLRFR